MARLTVGEKAPEFSLPSGKGTNLALTDLKGHKVVLYFYPKDDTPGCTKEACAFRDNQARIKRKGAVVVGVSTDDPDAHAKFAGKYDLSFPLLSDTTKDVVRTYGVWKKKSLYGRTFMGTERTTFVIDEHGIITHIFPRVKVDGHVDQVLDALAER